MRSRTIIRPGVYPFLLVLLTLAVSAVTVSAQQPSEEELADYRTIMMTSESEEKVILIDAFLEQYPESIIIPTLLRLAIPEAAKIDPASSKVLDYAKRLIMAEEETPMAHNNAAWALFEANAHLDTAAEWAAIAIEGFPAEDTSAPGKRNRALVLDTVANLAHVLGDTDRAIRLQTEAGTLDPGNPGYPVTLSKFLVSSGRYEEAETLVVDALLLNPRDVNTRKLLEEIASNRTEGDLSADEFVDAAVARGVERVQAEADDAALARQSLAGALADLGLLTDVATEFAMEAVNEFPGSPTANAIMGDLLVKAEKWDEAEPYLMVVLLQTPQDGRARRAFLLLLQKGVKEGMDTDAYKEAVVGRGIELMLAGDEDPLELKRMLSASLSSLDVHLDKALLFAREVAEATGTDTGADAFLAARVTLAGLELEQGNYEAVLDALEPAARLATPYAYDYHLSRGKALEELGRPEEAIEAYLESAGMVPNPAVLNPLRALWEQVYGEEKDLDEVISAIQEDLESWHPTSEFEVPDDWSGRVVLAELFTGSECPPCVASDMAYDYLLEYYPNTVLGILEYHLHIPGPDPMTSPDAEARMEYYNARERVIGGTPTSIVNGTEVSVGGGGSSAAKARFNLYAWSIESRMSATPEIAIDLSGIRAGTSIQVSGTVSITGEGLQGNEQLRLRIALAEKMIHHEGGNGITEHKMVVRKLIGGAEGFVIDTSEGTFEFSASVDVAELETDLLAYLTDWETEHSDRFRGGSGFSARRHEIDVNQLVLVAFVQDDGNRSVLQARVIDLQK